VHKRGLPETIRMKHDLHYVEEIFQHESGAIGKYIPIDLIRPNPSQPRQTIGDLTELVASIREKGVLEPLLVRPEDDGTYQIIAGERRWRASKELGLNTLPCIEKDVDDREMLELALIENLQRRDLSPWEEAEGLQVLGERFHYTHAQIAQVIGKSRTSVTELLSLNQIPGDIREMCREADISSKSLLLQVVRQPGIPEMRQLVQQIAKQNLNRQDLRDQKEVSRKAKPFIYQFKGSNFKLSLKFNKSHVAHDEIVEALESTLKNLK
jgi:ParB family transcriptional regulator, chromosome partitioning protein